MAGPATVQVDIVAAVADFNAQISSATQNLAQSMKSMAASVQGSGAGADKAKKSHDGLLGTLREYKGEQVQQARMAKFFANELIGMGVAGQQAGAMIQAGMAVAIEGFSALSGPITKASLALAGIGIAVAVAQFIAEHFREAAKAAEEAKQKTAEWGKEINEVGDKAEALRRKRTGVSESSVTRQQILDLETYSKGINRTTVEQQGAIGRIAALRKLYTEQLQAEQREYLGIATALVNEGRSIAAITEEQKIQAEYQNKLDEIAQKSLDPIYKQLFAEKAINNALAERKKQLEELRIEQTMKFARMEGGIGDVQEGTLAGLADLKERDKKEADARREKQVEYAMAEAKAAGIGDEDLNLEGRGVDRTAKNWTDALDTARQHAADLVQVGAQLGQTWGASLAAMAQGTITVAQGIATMVGASVDMIIDMAQRIITAMAAAAAAEAYVSQAATPFIGPVLGLVAAGAALGIVRGFLSMVGREKGGPVYAGRSYVVGERRPEVFTPSANGFISPTLAGAGGGVVVNFNLGGVLDGRHFERVLAANKDAVYRTVASAVRSGSGRRGA